MDEAGYGPNIGPLVVTASVWEVSGDPKRCDFWTLLADAVTQESVSDSRLRIADSKQVYSPGRGLRELERSVLACLSLLGSRPQTFRELIAQITANGTSLDVEPWFANSDGPLPLANSVEDVDAAAARLKASLAEAGIRCRTIRSDVILTERFNRLVRELDNKAAALSRASMQLLRSVWNLEAEEPTLVIGDKHGGRDRYADLLIDVLDGRMVMVLEEGGLRSRYKLGNSELRFQQKAEAHFPVAVSSMVCKYAREVALELLNSFWQKHIPDLRPTKGYPQDAKRFRAETEEVRRQLGIVDDIFWRER
jgi:hypothetical protein